MPKIPRVEPSLALFVRRMRVLAFRREIAIRAFARMQIGHVRSSSLNPIAVLYSGLLKLLETSTMQHMNVIVFRLPFGIWRYNRIIMCVCVRFYIRLYPGYTERDPIPPHSFSYFYRRFRESTDS